MAAGKGTRMKSGLPKVLHRLGGRALLAHVIESAAGLRPRRLIVVTGHGAEQVDAAARSYAQGAGLATCDTVLQSPQLGTGHAVQQALPLLPEDGICLVLNGDVPLIETVTLQALVQACGGERLALLTVDMADPSGYGRIVREGEAVRAIVEHKDATEAQRRITEIYSGFMAAPNRLLRDWLSRLKNDNAQGEYYLTDVVKFAVQDGVAVTALRTPDPVQVDGVNSPLQLAQLERAYQLRRARALMEQGVRLAEVQAAATTAERRADTLQTQLDRALERVASLEATSEDGRQRLAAMDVARLAAVDRAEALAKSALTHDKAIARAEDRMLRLQAKLASTEAEYQGRVKALSEQITGLRGELEGARAEAAMNAAALDAARRERTGRPAADSQGGAG